MSDGAAACADSEKMTDVGEWRRWDQGVISGRGDCRGSGVSW